MHLRVCRPVEPDVADQPVTVWGSHIMANIAPPLEVERPTSPAARRYSIFDAANGPLPLSRLADVWYQVPWCASATAYDVDCESPPGLEKGPPPITIDGTAFTVDADLSCAMPGRSFADMESDVRAKLEASEHVAVEEKLGDEIAAAAASDAANNLGAVLDIVQAVSVLEDFAYSTRRYGLRAVLHVPIALWAMAADRTQFMRNGSGPWSTMLGTIAVPNAGLLDTEVYVTGQVTLWRGNTTQVTRLEQAADRVENEWNMHAERDWAVTWECFNAMVTVEVA